MSDDHENWTAVLLPIALIAGLVAILTLNPGPALAEPEMTNVLTVVVGYVAMAAELAAVLVIGLGVLRAMITFVAKLRSSGDAVESIRVQLGRALALGLEFTIASDILRTVVAPSRQMIANLAAIVLLRTLLNYFLEREIKQGART